VDGGGVPDQLIAHSAARGHRVEALPVWLHLTVSNLCNLACRMCTSSYSSQIEQHAELASISPPLFGVEPSLAPARIRRRTIGPQPVLGVSGTGFGPDGRLATARATLELGVAWFEKPMMLHLALGSAPRGGTLAIAVNGRRLLEQPVDRLGGVLDLDMSWLEDSEHLTVELIAGGTAGLSVESIALSVLHAPDAVRRAGKVGQRPSANHLPAIEALVANPDLLYIHFTGGETMLMPEVAEVVDYLIADGRASKMSITVTTNVTRVDVRLIEQLKKFRKFTLYLSIDGTGAQFEYIRVPARWSRVSENVRQLVALAGAEHLIVHPCVQAYNILNMVDVFEFVDQFDLRIHLLDILVWPLHLTHQVMPPQVRAIALERVRRYRAQRCRPWNHASVDNLIANLEQTMDAFRSDLLPFFMRFTNELDRIHKQSFREAQSELFGLIEAGGFRWVDEGWDDAVTQRLYAKIASVAPRGVVEYGV
jgi:MoaA/NifB/PqqE/SkfB family radical SAM enzyme